MFSIPCIQAVMPLSCSSIVKRAGLKGLDFRLLPLELPPLMRFPLISAFR